MAILYNHCFIKLEKLKLGKNFNKAQFARTRINLSDIISKKLDWYLFFPYEAFKKLKNYILCLKKTFKICNPAILGKLSYYIYMWLNGYVKQELGIKAVWFKRSYLYWLYIIGICFGKYFTYFLEWFFMNVNNLGWG